MKHEILLVGADVAPLSEVSRYLDDDNFDVAFAQTADPLPYVIEHSSRLLDGAIIRLAGSESVEDFQSLFLTFPKVSFIFLTPRPMLSDEIAGVVQRYHGVLSVAGEEPPYDIAMNLISLMFQKRLE